jgi:DNA polymerase-3 subunit alpha (Gram-positive type)
MIKDYVCVDIETTGTSAKWNKILEIGAVKVRDGKVVDKFSKLVYPGVAVPGYITGLTGITDEMVMDKEDISVVFPEFMEFSGDDYLLGHNVMFDYGFLKQNAMNLNLTFDKSGIDTLKIARKTLPHLDSRALDYLCTYYGIRDENHHRALNDATVTAQLYHILMEQFGQEYPGLFEPKEFSYTVKKLQPITEKQKKYLVALMKYHEIEMDFNIESLTKNEASKKIDKILSEKGRILY